MQRRLGMIGLALLLAAVPAYALSFNGVVLSANDGSPVQPGESVVVGEGSIRIGTVEYPVRFEDWTGVYWTILYGAPMRPEVGRGWIQVNPLGSFDGVYGNWPDGPYWKYAGVGVGSPVPEPSTAVMLLAAVAVFIRRKR